MKHIDFLKYIVDDKPKNNLIDYANSPCKVFLEEVDGVYEAINFCITNLPDSEDGNSGDAISQITIAALGTIMGQLELYQRFTFASAFELTRHIEDFNLERCVKNLEKEAGLNIDVSRLCAYRGQPTPVGQLLADSLGSWHNPDKVNSYMNSIIPNLSFYSNDDRRVIKVLWQLRHTAVHTGGWLTLPDAQKVPELASLGNKAIFFKPQFTKAVARQLFTVCIKATQRLKAKMITSMPESVVASKEFKKLVSFENNRPDWTPEETSENQ